MGTLTWKTFRTPVGFLVAPFVAATTVRAILPRVLDWYSESDLGLAALATAAIVTVLVAMPANIVLRQHQRTGWLSYVLAGAAMGTTPFLLYLAFALPAILVTNGARSVEVLRESPSGNLAGLCSIGAIAGSISALAFWVIAVRERDARR